jgi:hypothetical protein
MEASSPCCWKSISENDVMERSSNKLDSIQESDLCTQETVYVSGSRQAVRVPRPAVWPPISSTWSLHLSVVKLSLANLSILDFICPIEKAHFWVKCRHDDELVSAKGHIYISIWHRLLLPWFPARQHRSRRRLKPWAHAHELAAQQREKARGISVTRRNTADRMDETLSSGRAQEFNLGR